MKKSLVILAAMAAFVFGATSCNTNTATTSNATESGSTVSAQKGSIVYFDLGRVMSEYDMANDKVSAFNTKAQGIMDEINRRGNSIQNELNTLQDKYNKGLITTSTAQAQERQIQQKGNDFSNYQMQKEQELAEEQNVLNNQIADAIKTYVDKLQSQNGYAMVIATQGDILPMPVCSADPSLDITDMILEGLNSEYVSSKNEK